MQEAWNEQDLEGFVGRYDEKLFLVESFSLLLLFNINLINCYLAAISTKGLSSWDSFIHKMVITVLYYLTRRLLGAS